MCRIQNLASVPFLWGGKEHTKTRGNANFLGFVEKCFVKYVIPAPPHAVVAQWGWMRNDTTVRSPEMCVLSLTLQAGGKVQWLPIASCLRQDAVYIPFLHLNSGVTIKKRQVCHDREGVRGVFVVSCCSC